MLIMKFASIDENIPVKYINFDNVCYWEPDADNLIYFSYNVLDSSELIEFRNKETRDNALKLIDNCINCYNTGKDLTVQTIHTLV